MFTFPFFFILGLLSHSALQKAFMMKNNLSKQKNVWQLMKPNIIYYVVALTAICLLLLTDHWSGLVLFLILFPLFTIGLFSSLHEDKSLVQGFQKFFLYINYDKGRIFLFFLIFLITGYIFYRLVNAPLAYFYADIIVRNIPPDAAWAETFMEMVMIFLRISAFNLVFLVGFTGFGMLTFTLKEIAETPQLSNRIDEIAS